MAAPDTATLRQQAEERLAAFRLNVDDVTDADVRFISGVLDFLDEQDKADEKATERLNDILTRRGHAPYGESMEATTPQDIEDINAITQEQRPVVRLLVRAVRSVWADFGHGRCSVCGMTTAQAEAANYNCTEEC